MYYSVNQTNSIADLWDATQLSHSFYRPFLMYPSTAMECTAVSMAPDDWDILSEPTICRRCIWQLVNWWSWYARIDLYPNDLKCPSHLIYSLNQFTKHELLHAAVIVIGTLGFGGEGCCLSKDNLPTACRLDQLCHLQTNSRLDDCVQSRNFHTWQGGCLRWWWNKHSQTVCLFTRFLVQTGMSPSWRADKGLIRFVHVRSSGFVRLHRTPQLKCQCHSHTWAECES